MTSLAQLERGVVGYWCPMLATTGLRLYDRSVRKNHGTLTNMDAATDWVTASVRGRNGRVLDFDGSNDSVIAENLPVRSNGSPLSFGGWFFAPSASYSLSNYFLSIPFVSSGSNGLDFTNPQAVRFNLFGAGTNISIDSTVDLRVGWTHLVGVFNGSAGLVYANGRLSVSASHTAGVNTASRQLNIGRFGSFGGNTAIRCTEAFLQYRALTAAEIHTLYRLGPGWFGRRELRRRYAVSQAAGVAGPVLFHQHYVNQGWR